MSEKESIKKKLEELSVPHSFISDFCEAAKDASGNLYMEIHPTIYVYLMSKLIDDRWEKVEVIRNNVFFQRGPTTLALTINSGKS